MTDLDDLADSYAVAYDGHLRPEPPVVLLNVDVCRAYVEPTSPLYAGVEDSLAAIARLTDAARATGTPVIWTRVRYRPGGGDGGRFYEKVPALEAFVEGNPLGEWTPEACPADDELVVTKRYPSAFFGTDLAERLAADGVRTVVITGWSTSGCVRASALDALCHGFVPVVVRDAVGDRDRRPHEQNLFDLQAKYAEVVDEGTALGILTDG